ncbi:MAG: Holliday junction resolvase RuvX [Salinivirgaceae bacterium]|nr:Holliday junction resolvase RuvX [Salinivirgaceae bacterium]
MGRILAIDYGRKRCGIAVTDPLQIIANGLQTVPTAALMDFLRDYTNREKVDVFVVGYAKHLDSTDSESMQYINPFVKKLQATYPNIPVKMVDERFTSKMAFQTMIDGGMKKKQRQDKAMIDTISATLILQSYMQQQTFLK